MYHGILLVFHISDNPLTIAIKTNAMDIVTFLVDNGADVNFKLIIFLFIFFIVT